MRDGGLTSSVRHLGDSPLVGFRFPASCRVWWDAQKAWFWAIFLRTPARPGIYVARLQSSHTREISGRFAELLLRGSSEPDSHCAE